MKKMMSLVPNRWFSVLGVYLIPMLLSARELSRFDIEGIKAAGIGIGLFFVEFVIVPAIIIALICLGIRTIRGFFNI